jgi:hypothetical protein
MHPTLLVYRTMQARAWVMVWVEHPKRRECRIRLGAKGDIQGPVQCAPVAGLLAKDWGDIHGTLALPGASE